MCWAGQVMVSDRAPSSPCISVPCGNHRTVGFQRVTTWIFPRQNLVSFKQIYRIVCISSSSVALKQKYKCTNQNVFAGEVVCVNVILWQSLAETITHDSHDADESPLSWLLTNLSNWNFLETCKKLRG